MTMSSRLSLVVFAFLFVLAPHTALAATPTIAELQARVIGLQAELAVLKAARGIDANFVFATPAATFDLRSYTSVSHYPTLSGTANVPSVFIIVRDEKGVGISGTALPVEKGVWKYSSVAYLPRGVYTIELVGGVRVETRNLVVDAQ